VSPRLIKTEAVVEGRVEERWTLVEDDATPEYDDANPPAIIGTPTPRVTAKLRLDGSARYTSDIKLPGQLEAAVLRSPHANARLTAIDVEAARAVPGVRCVITAEDDLPTLDGDALLTAEPGYAGAAVAAVAAETAEAAAAALDALAPQWEELGFIIDIDAAADAQRFLEDPTEYERGDVDAALEGAAQVVEEGYRVPAQLHNSMEPHCAVAEWRGEDLTVWSSTQAIYEGRAQLARAFGIPAERVRVICEFMGGGFGSKFGVGAEGVLAAILAKRSRHAVRLVFTRREENLTAGYRTEARAELRVGADADGTLRGIEASVVMGLGSEGWTYPILEPMKAVYKCDNVRGFVLPVGQNLGPSAAFRAPGVMEGTFMLELALDELADALGIDPLELRRKNYVEDDQQAGRPYTSKNLLDCYDQAAELAGWADRDSLRSDGRVRRGMGMATQIWWGGGGPPAYAEVRLGKDARPMLEIGMQDLGTGVTTACAMITAERLGVSPQEVLVLAGDTTRAGHGPASGGSMTLASVAPAVRAAAHDTRAQLLDLAADMFEIAASDLTLEGGEIRSVDGTLRRPITDLTGKLGNAWVTGRGSRSPNPDGMSVNTFGCQIATVAVDTHTGEARVERIVAVHDIGRVVNPMGARSQALGGILQGIGYALMEERVVDPTTGTVVNAGLEDYKLPTIADLPEVVCEFVNRPDPKLAMGIKGLGEPPIIPTAGAIGNALAHALGVRLREAPFTPRRILEALS
jgi:xanthine dehydrogenase YagR molybdenum-binding subunit